MPSIQIRIFRRTFDQHASDYNEIIQALEDEANEFMATFPLGDVLDVQYLMHPLAKYGTRVCFVISVTYVET